MYFGKFSVSALLGAALATGALTAQAQDIVVDKAGVVPYVVDGRNVVARSGTGLCWRTGYWSPALASSAMAGQFPAGCGCDKDIVPQDKCSTPAPAAAPAPAPAAAAPKPIVLSAKALFGFDKDVLTPAGMRAIDQEVIAKLPMAGEIMMITVEGHTDRIGSHQYNQALSERRAMAVKNYLVKKGLKADMIDAIGYGKTNPVPGVKCADTLKRTDLIACLEPHRRVQVSIKTKAK
ncbi:MAG: OmpA family protein [Rhodocyclales bacterium]|nr:OmpA family protein [Rhodocyclales bacterium]